MPTQFISRRCFLAGAGVALTAISRPLDLNAETAVDGFRILRARIGTSQGDETVWSYDAALPGPTLRIKRGEELRVRLINELPEPTSIHWHGVRVPNAMDGVAGLTQAPVAPGASFDYRFPPPDAGTFCYHAPIASQADRGLSGALIVEESEPVDVDRDIVLVFGQPLETGGLPSPAFVLVNGALRPAIPVTAGERLRLRLINATATRGFALKLDGHAPWVMAVDGQPAEPFLARDGRIGLAPGSRVDLIADMSRDGGTVAPILAGTRDEHPIARLVYASAAAAPKPARPDPPPLPANALPARIDLKGALRAELALGSVKPLDPAAPPLFAVRRGRAVTLAIRNPTGHPQAVHVHGHAFRHLDRLDDGWKPYWLDTIVVGEQIERVAFVADNPGKWLIGARMLEHADIATQVWFAVT